MVPYGSCVLDAKFNLFGPCEPHRRTESALRLQLVCYAHRASCLRTPTQILVGSEPLQSRFRQIIELSAKPPFQSLNTRLYPLHPPDPRADISPEPVYHDDNPSLQHLWV